MTTSERLDDALRDVERAAREVDAFFGGEPGAWTFAGGKLPDTDDTGESDAALALLSLHGYLLDVARERRAVSSPSGSGGQSDG